MEYITDDARLTLENALSAAQHGAHVANHAAVTSFLVRDGKVAGARVRDETDGKVREVRAAVVVNATGPWAEETIALSDSPAPRRVLPSKGIHLLFRADRLPLQGAVALKSPSGREGFAVRRWGHVYVGTSDVAHEGPLDEPLADREALEDVLQMTQVCFPSLGLTEADVVATWAGLRPLIAEAGRSPRDTSRHDEVWRSPEGLVSIVGGKLTTYRRMAERVMRHVGRALGGLDFDTWRAGIATALISRGVSAVAAERITWLYGAAAEEILRLGDREPAWLEPLAEGSAAVRGEVRLAVEQGMALTLADILDRRTGLLLFSEDRGLAAAPAAAAIAGELLGWSLTETAAQLDACRHLAAEHRAPARPGPGVATTPDARPAAVAPGLPAAVPPAMPAAAPPARPA